MNNIAPKVPSGGTRAANHEQSARELDVLSDVGDRVVRGVKHESGHEIHKIVGLIGLEEASRRWGYYTLRMLPDHEIKEAAEASSPSNHLSRAEAGSELDLILPESFYSPVDNAQVQGVEYQEAGRRFGISVSYPGLEQEVQAWKVGLNTILGIEYEWSDENPIIDIVMQGSMGHTPTKMTELEAACPDTVNLFEVPRIPSRF